jgi:hypothetical protein
MQLRLRATLRLGLAAAVLLVSLTFAPAAAAHAHVHVGDFSLAIGWMNEPTFVGQPNGIEVFVEDHDENPVTDLGDESLSLVVSTDGQDSPTMALTAAFSIEGGFGTPGQYTAPLIPTTPGAYTLHITGTIHDQAVDVSITSGEETFSSVQGSSDIEFPVKVPSLADVATRLDRIDGRIEEIASLQAAVDDARAAADNATRMGLLVGGAALVVAVVALWLALRTARRGTGTA